MKFLIIKEYAEEFRAGSHILDDDLLQGVAAFDLHGRFVGMQNGVCKAFVFGKFLGQFVNILLDLIGIFPFHAAVALVEFFQNIAQLDEFRFFFASGSITRRHGRNFGILVFKGNFCRFLFHSNFVTRNL